jgi:hypothetical protein
MIPNGYCDIGLGVKFGVIEIPLWVMTRNWRQVIENKEGILLMDRMRWLPDGKELQTWFYKTRAGSGWDWYGYRRIGPFDGSDLSTGGREGGWRDPWGFSGMWDDYSSISEWFGRRTKKKAGG